MADYPRFFLMPDSCHVESNSDGTNVIRLGDPSDHIDHEVELVIRLGEDLRPASMCIGCDTTNRTRQSLAIRCIGHLDGVGSKAEEVDALRKWRNSSE